MIVIHSLVPPMDLHFCYKIVTSNGNHGENIRGKNAHVVVFCLKGLSHEVELAFDDMHGRSSNDFIRQKVYFSQLMRVCVVLIMLEACT